MMAVRTTEGAAVFFTDIAGSIGAEHVDCSDASVRFYGETTLPAGDRPPLGIVRPASAEDVRAIVLAAGRHRVPLYPVSGGWNLGMGTRAPVAAGQVVVDLGVRMGRVLEVDETLAYCVIEPGVSFQALHEDLLARGSRLMLSPTAGPPLGSVIGNALDRGAGSGPAGDHFGNACGLEIVLGNGEIIRTGDGSLDMASLPNWHVSKYCFGPALDGLFTQSNFGIVTRMGVWLQPRPAAIRHFFFAFPDDEDIGEIIDLIRVAKFANMAPTLIRATNDLYLAGAQTPSPVDGPPGTALSPAARRELQRQFGIGAWTISGALYGGSQAALAPSLDRLRGHFEASGRARYIDEAEARPHPVFGAALLSNAGIPGSGELGLLKWRPGNGAIWFLPGLPMRGAVARAIHAEGRAICDDHGLDYMVSNVCGPRFARSIHALIFNRDDAEERGRADSCYRRLAEAYFARGISVGRAPIDYQAFHHAHRAAPVRDAMDAIKAALDPQGIIAPGRYGIG
jgi:4-cresol dehydrogenase (hydroxylating)